MAYDPAVGWYVKERALERVADLAVRGLDLVEFWREVNEAITPAIPHFRDPCWFAVDPASLLVTSHYEPALPELPREWLAHEYYEDDVLKMADVARSARGVSTLREATGGDHSRSKNWRLFVEPYGGDQQLLGALRTGTGEAWGIVGIYRERGQPEFSHEEIQLIRSLSPYLAEGARRGLLIGEAREPDGPEPPGLVVLGDNWEVESLTPGVERWFAELPDGDPDRGDLPSAVLAVAARALRTAERAETPGEIAFARVLSREGRWIVLHGAPLVSNARRRVA